MMPVIEMDLVVVNATYMCAHVILEPLWLMFLL